MIDNLNYYKIFYEVAKTGSISKAAENLYISQPAVSKSISNLESSLNTVLFNRSSRGVYLNDEGVLLYTHLKSAFESINRAEDELGRINELGIGELRIGVSTSLCKHILLSYLKSFIAKSPHIKIVIDCHSTFNTIRQLQEGNIDIGMICETKLPPEFTYIPVSDVHDIFIASESYLKNLSVRESGYEYELGNPFLFAGNVTSLMQDDSGEKKHRSDTALKETDDMDFPRMKTRDILEKANLMLLEKQNISRIHIDKYMYNNDINPGQVLEINNMDLLIDFAAIGMGVSAVVKEFATKELADKKVIELPLETPVPTRTIGFAMKRNQDKNNPAIKLVEMCVQNDIIG